MAIGSLGGATLDNEENYLIKKLFCCRAGHGLDRKPGPCLTQLLGAQSGCLLRTRRRHHGAMGCRQCRLHRRDGLQHGGEPPDRLPLRAAGEGAGRDASSMWIRASPAPRRWPTSMRRSAPAPTSPSSAADQLHARERPLVQGVRAGLYQHRARSSTTASRTPRTGDGLFSGWNDEKHGYQYDTWQYEGMAMPSVARRALPQHRRDPPAMTHKLTEQARRPTTARCSTRIASTRS